MTHSAMTRRHRRRTSSGQSMVEATFVLMAFIAFIFLIIDMTWGLLAKEALQNGVRAGVRYAVTSQTSGSLGQVASIQKEVEQQAMGFISDAQASSLVSVCFYSVTSNPPTSLGCGTGATASSVGPANSGGNLVTVSVTNYPFNPIVSLYMSSGPISITVSSSDLIESSGTGGVPPSL
ncbi:MAG: TadE/TadG family type IV pilus assembly protein [Terracidiphilus sp.]